MPQLRLLRVTAHIRGPYVDRGDPIHLDGILARAYVRRHGQCNWYQSPGRTLPAPADVLHLPLAQVSFGGHWLWTASAAIEIAPAVPAAIHQTRRRDPEDWHRLERPINVASGPSKDVLIRREARSVAALRWWAIGHRRQVIRDLRLLWGPQERPHGAVGSARRSGAGEVARWSVEAVEGEHDTWAVGGGLARRHLPIAWTKAATSRTGAYRGPYWHPARQVQVCEVGQPVTLRPEALQAVCCAAGV